MSNFHPLEDVGRDSETQLQIGENLNYLIWRHVEVLPHKVNYCSIQIMQYGGVERKMTFYSIMHNLSPKLMCPFDYKYEFCSVKMYLLTVRKEHVDN